MTRRSDLSSLDFILLTQKDLIVLLRFPYSQPTIGVIHILEGKQTTMFPELCAVNTVKQKHMFGRNKQFSVLVLFCIV